MSHATLLHEFGERIAKLKGMADGHGALPAGLQGKAPGVHGIDDAPSSLFDYAKSADRPAHRVGEMVHDSALKQLQLWNQKDSVRPLMNDAKPLVTFSIMLHDSNRSRNLPHGDAVSYHDFEYEPDDVEDDLNVPDQVGYKESQQMGIKKQAKDDSITVEKIKQAYAKVTTSLQKIDTNGRKRVTEDAYSEWDEHIRKCRGPSDLFNCMNALPFANERSPEVLVIANFVTQIPNPDAWLPALLTEHFENGTESDEWRKSKVHAYWKTMVDSYVRLLPPSG